MKKWIGLLALAAFLTAVGPGGLTGGLFGFDATAQAAGFGDTENHWSKVVVSRMNAKGIVSGYPGGEFRPEQGVTRTEAVVMLVRVLGHEAEAVLDSQLPSGFQGGDGVAAWARGYVAEAASLGLLSTDDMRSFRGQERATRLEIATWSVRALEREAAALAGSGSLPFTDVAGLNETSKDYIRESYQQGLFQGDTSGRFRPFDNVKRGEMAAVLSRIDDKVETSLDARQLKGRVDGVASGGFTVRLDGGIIREFRIDSETAIYLDDQSVSLWALAPGDTVEVVADAEGLARFVAASMTTIEASGTITDIDRGDNVVLTIEDEDGTSTEYTLSSGVDVTLDGRAASVSSLEVGQSAELEGIGDRITEVAATSPLEELEAQLTAVIAYDASTRLISVKYEDEEGETVRDHFYLAAGLKVTRDGETATLEDLESNDLTTLGLRGEYVYTIEAESYEREFEEATIKALRFTSEGAVLDFEHDGEDFSYVISGKADLERDDKRIGLTSLQAGEVADILVQNREVVELVIAEGESTEVKGRVNQLIVGTALPQLVITRTSDGTEATYEVADSARIYVDGDREDLLDLKQGYQVTLTLDAGVIVRIDATTAAALDQVQGTVRYLDERADTFIITRDKGADADDSTWRIFVGSDTMYLRYNTTSSDMDVLEIGDEVTIFGQTVTGGFRATTVVVTASEE